MVVRQKYSGEEMVLNHGDISMAQRSFAGFHDDTSCGMHHPYPCSTCPCSLQHLQRNMIAGGIQPSVAPSMTPSSLTASVFEHLKSLGHAAMRCIFHPLERSVRR